MKKGSFPINKNDQLDTQTILIVEDDEELNRLIAKQLRRTGLNTLSVLNGNEAINRIAENNIECVLLDYKLPDMTACEILDELERSAIKVAFVIMTGYGDEHIAVEMMKRGALDYIVKDTHFNDVLPHKMNYALHQIFQQKQMDETERSLLENEKRFRQIYENMEVGISRLSLDFKVESANKAYCAMLGYEELELIGKHLKEFTHPDCLEENLKKQKMLASGEIDHYRLEKKYIHKTGEVVTGILDANLIRDHQGNPSYFLGTVVNITKINRAREALKESENFMRELLNAIPNPVFYRDREGKYKGVNKAFESFFGRQEEALLGQSVYDIYTPNQARRFFKMDQQLMETGGTQRYETKMKNWKGELKDVLVDKAVVKNKQGNVAGLIGVFHDITNRKKLEKELDRRANNLKTISEMAINLNTANKENDPFRLIAKELKRITQASFTSISLYNPEEKVLTVQQVCGDNQLIESITDRANNKRTGYKAPLGHQTCHQLKEELIVELPDLYSALSGALTRGDAEFIQKTSKMERFISLALTVGKELIGTSLIILPEHHHTPSEKVLKVFAGVAAASIKQRQAEKALKESENKFRIITESSADAIFLTDEKGHYQYVNTMATKLLGYSQEELLQMNVDEISMEKKMGRPVTPQFDQLLEEGQLVTELELKKKDGTILPVDLNAVLLPNGLVYGSCRDISERKKTEQELIKAKEKAEESDHLKSAFLANMSHEIRTPMNGIIGFANLLNNPDLSSENQKEYIRLIEKSGERMLNIINDLIHISQIESGQINITTSKSNINEQIHYLCDFFKPEAHEKKLTLVCHTPLPDEEAIMETDHEKLLNILTNLIKNALKFTPEGRIDVGYRVENDRIHFYVKDTGIGIPKEKQHSIFDRFVQADMNIARAYEGSGLGLSITKAYVEKLKGSIWVESEEGRGSAFHFSLPFKGQSSGHPNQSTVNPPQARKKVKDLKLLVVEDDRTSVQYLTALLEPECKEIIVASNGQEAIDTAKNNPDVEVILMDIKMPVMDGYTATKKIREFNQQVIIIAQTAFAMKGDRQKALDAGCTEYITKPIDKDSLLEIIREHFV